MKRHKWLIVGGLFLVLSSLIISTSEPIRDFLPSREVMLSHTAAYIPLLKAQLFIQEITLNRRYLNRIDILLGNIPGASPTLNVFLLLDKDQRILYSKRFSSNEINGPTYFPFEFGNKRDIGKENRVYACIYSPDSDGQNFLMALRNPETALGSLTEIPIQNNDIPSALANPASRTTLPGSLGVKIYETNTLSFSWQVLLYVLAFLVFLFLVFQKRITPCVGKIEILPERVFLGISLLFGLAFAFITPPFQVADEPSHLFRSWQISEFNLFKYNDKAPESLVHLSTMANRMMFMAHEKTGIDELTSLAEIELNEEDQSTVETPNYILPYLPQALGISLGDWLGINPLGQFYLARILNLLVCLFILFQAIRITPVLKWLFFLLSLLPMVLYQMASLSYDAMTISLSFLLTAILFKLAFGTSSQISIRDLASLFIVSAFLALCKPPYYIIALAFLIIPASKLGSRKRFILIFLGLAATIIVCSQLWSVTREVFRPREQVSGFRFQVPGSRFNFQQLFTPTLKGAVAENKTPFNLVSSIQDLATSIQHPVTSYPASSIQHPASTIGHPASGIRHLVSDVSKPTYDYSLQEQQNYILADPFRYLGILGNTLSESGHLYLISFIGLFGWVDTPLPWFLIILYYLMLVFISATTPTTGINVNWKKKSILLTIFLLGFVLVETAMYICCNTVGSDQVMAVQGRYFIAFGPLIFILFYNNRISELIGGASSRSVEKTGKHKRNKKRDLNVQEAKSRLVYTGYLSWFVILFGIGGLLYSLYVILTRFYIITV